LAIDNHNYNLAKALTKKAQAVWRYGQYKKDSQGCEKCRALWEKLEKEDGLHLEEMKKLLGEHLG
jgi:hypothetical protein